MCLHVVLRDAFAGGVYQPEVELPGGESLFSPPAASIFGTNRPIIGSAAEVASTGPSGFGTEEAGDTRCAQGEKNDEARDKIAGSRPDSTNVSPRWRDCPSPDGADKRGRGVDPHRGQRPAGHGDLHPDAGGRSGAGQPHRTDRD